MPLFRRKNDKQKKSLSSNSFNKSQLSGAVQNGNLGVAAAAESSLGAQSHRILDCHKILSHDLLNRPIHTSSRLSKTIHEVLHDRDALPYFLRYLESVGKVHLLRFWLDAQSFRAASLTRIRTPTVKNVRRKNQNDDGGTSLQSETEAKRDICDTIDGVIDGDISTVHDLSQTLNVDIRTDASALCDTPSPTSPVTRHFRGSDIQMSHVECNDSFTCFISNNNENLGAFKNAILQQYTDDISNRTSDSGQSNTPVSEDGLAEKFLKSIARDAVTIYSKYISLDAPLMIELPEEVRNDAISKICQEDGSVDVTCFNKCQEFVVEILHKNYFDNFRQSVHHFKHQIDVLTSGKVYLADILYNDSAMFYFMEYIEREGASKLLQFVLTADNFQQHLQKLQPHEYIAEQTLTDAMVLYDKYFSLQASEPLGFSDEVRFDIESNICRETGPLPDCFSTPRNIVLSYIEETFFGDFVKSEIYYKYLTELISSVQLLEEPTVTSKHRRSGSETSSEYSLGSQNTLLASSQIKPLKKGGQHKLDDLDMDETYMNPEMLWKRSNAGPLKLGQVDKMGQFKSYFQPEPDCGKRKGTGSRFFTKNQAKLKEEEDMALKIAQMIISDVTSVTQGDSSQQNSSTDI